MILSFGPLLPAVAVASGARLWTMQRALPKAAVVRFTCGRHFPQSPLSGMLPWMSLYGVRKHCAVSKDLATGSPSTSGCAVTRAEPPKSFAMALVAASSGSGNAWRLAALRIFSRIRYPAAERPNMTGNASTSSPSVAGYIKICPSDCTPGAEDKNGWPHSSSTAPPKTGRPPREV